MAVITNPSASLSATSAKKNYTWPLVLVTSLFFLWGLSYGLLDVLNKHFQETMHVTKMRTTLLQLAYFGAYFVIALPAGYFMKKFGYKKGILTGLLLYVTGALLFYPSAEMASFNFFLLSLFIIACGLGFLETAANPYITVLGKPESSTFRLNLSQSFNGVGTFIGPIIGARLFFNDIHAAADQLSSVKYVYLVIGAVVGLIALLFLRTSLPEIKEEELVTDQEQHSGHTLFGHRHFVWAVVAQFFYVGAQVGIAALFINYCTELGLHISSQDASYYLLAGMLCFTIGRFAGTALMKKVPPATLLAVYAAINMVLCAVLAQWHTQVSIYLLIAVFFFESIMFPTIFALGVRNLGRYTKQGSSYIIMSIVGGVPVSMLMGYIATQYSTPLAYFIPVVCFLVVFLFGWYGYKIKKS